MLMTFTRLLKTQLTDIEALEVNGYSIPMTRLTKDAKYRLRDFNRRCSFALDDIYINEHLKQQYIAIHPFANESLLTERFNLIAEECQAVDAYWHMGNDVSFLQVGTTALYNTFPHGFYAQWRCEKKEYLTLTYVTESPFICRNEFEQAMCQFVELGWIPTEALRKQLKNNPLFLAINLS